MSQTYIQTDRQKDGHRDSMTELDQLADSVKRKLNIFKIVLNPGIEENVEHGNILLLHFLNILY